MCFLLLCYMASILASPSIKSHFLISGLYHFSSRLLHQFLQMFLLFLITATILLLKLFSNSSLFYKMKTKFLSTVSEASPNLVFVFLPSLTWRLHSMLPPVDLPRYCSFLHKLCTLTSNLCIFVPTFPSPETSSQPQAALKIIYQEMVYM